MTVAIEFEKEFTADMLIEHLNDEDDRVEKIVGELHRIPNGQIEKKFGGEEALKAMSDEDNDAKHVADQTRNANDGNQVDSKDHLDTFEDDLITGSVHRRRRIHR